MEGGLHHATDRQRQETGSSSGSLGLRLVFPDMEEQRCDRNWAAANPRGHMGCVVCVCVRYPGHDRDL